MINLLFLLLGFYCGGAFVFSQFLFTEDDHKPITMVERLKFGVIWPKYLKEYLDMMKNTE